MTRAPAGIAEAPEEWRVAMMKGVVTTRESAAALRLDRSALLDLEATLRREWLLVNDAGACAAGTPLGVGTRCYHGLLTAPVGSPPTYTLLLARLHETVLAGEDSYALHTCEYHDGTIHPAGYIFLQEFSLEAGSPVWRYRCRDIEIEKRLWMDQGASVVFVSYRLLHAEKGVQMRLEPFAVHRDPQGHTRGYHDWRFGVEIASDTCRVEAFPGATPLWLRLAGGHFVETGMWYWHFLRRHETGHRRLEDLYTPVAGGIDLQEGQSATLVASARREDLEIDPAVSYQRERTRRRGADSPGRPRWPLFLAGDWRD
jgi:predicted glycogen debranching enzyme